MTQAICLNENCEKDKPWTLRKHPSEYSSAISCPECGSTRVEVEGQGSQQNKPQAVDTPDRSGQQQMEVADNDPMLGMMAEAGKNMADLHNASKEEKVQFKGKAAKGALALALNYVDGRTQSELEEIQRSKNHGGEVKAAAEYASCAECGGQITNLPPEGTEFECPRCRTLLVA